MKVELWRTELPHLFIQPSRHKLSFIQSAPDSRRIEASSTITLSARHPSSTLHLPAAQGFPLLRPAPSVSREAPTPHLKQLI